MSEYYDEFKAKNNQKYTAKAIEKALKHHFEYPNLTRRLVNLKKQKVLLTSCAQNPLYYEMKEAQITEKDIEIIREYLKLKDKKKEAELRNFKKHNRGSCSMRPDYVRLPQGRTRTAFNSYIKTLDSAAESEENIE